MLVQQPGETYEIYPQRDDHDVHGSGGIIQKLVVKRSTMPFVPSGVYRYLITVPANIEFCKGTWYIIESHLP